MRSKALLILTILWGCLLLPTVAGAYTYGDPNEEEIAINFRDIAVKLGQSPADWTGAAEIYKVRRPEIVSHFGEPVAAELDANFAAKDTQSTLANFKGLLVMNLQRRFIYTEQSVADYAQAKLLLAKAKGTYDILQPYVKGQISGEQLQGIDTAFQKALDALGNPGLFGVGMKAADPAELKKQVTSIYSTLEPLFPFKNQPASQFNKGANPGNGDKAGAPAAHAPMERTKRTNPVASAVIIGAVAILVIGGVVYARRKGIF